MSLFQRLKWIPLKPCSNFFSLASRGLGLGLLQNLNSYVTLSMRLGSSVDRVDTNLEYLTKYVKYCLILLRVI